MTDYLSVHVRMPEDLPGILASMRALSLPNFIVQDSLLKSVAEYSLSRPETFPRPTEHLVIADYLIDNPIIAVDLGAASVTHGRVLAYSDGEHWLIAKSLSHLLERLKLEKEIAVWGLRSPRSC